MAQRFPDCDGEYGGLHVLVFSCYEMTGWNCGLWYRYGVYIMSFLHSWAEARSLLFVLCWSPHVKERNSCQITCEDFSGPLPTPD